MQVEAATVILVRASRERVAAVLFNPSLDPFWRANVKAVVSAPPGPLALGTRVHRTWRLFGREFSLDHTVTEVDPGSRLVMRAATPFPAELAYDLEDGADGTFVRAIGTAWTSGFFAFSAPLLRLRMQTGLDRDLVRLRTLCEQEGPREFP